VTSSTNLDVCKKVCDELLVKMLEMGLGKDSTGNCYDCVNVFLNLHVKEMQMTKKG
jgi:hypothetical protein